jgi:ketosteroid isomerase-like protein
VSVADTFARNDSAVIERLYDALARGDIAAARACCSPDAVVWHSFDQIALDLDATVRGWEQLVAGFPERAFADVRRTPTPDGWVVRQLMLGRTVTGVRLAWPLCAWITLRDGLIARLDEYIDRAGSYEVDDDGLALSDLSTPGLPPRS